MFFLIQMHQQLNGLETLSLQWYTWRGKMSFGPTGFPCKNNGDLNLCSTNKLLQYDIDTEKLLMHYFSTIRVPVWYIATIRVYAYDMTIRLWYGLFYHTRIE